MNRLQLKALLLSVITEIKYGKPLDRNAKQLKKHYKAMAGLKARASNQEVLTSIGLTYRDNGLEFDYWRIVDKFGVQKYVIQA